jgi:hypothetical protein
MRIDQTLEPVQGQASLPHRAAFPQAPIPQRRVEAIGQTSSGEDAPKVAAAPPDDAITLDLSSEGREAARQAAIEQLQRRLDGDAGESGTDGRADPDDRRVDDLRRRDREARAREQAVRAAAGALSAGRTNYSYQVGPDGRLYVVSSEVQFDTSEIPGNPEATLRKAEQLQRAALAAGGDSPRERAIAAVAAMMASRARRELGDKTESGGAPAEGADHEPQA